mgnify:CR=1 FL=1|jgi:hypothetical protein
MFSIAFFLSFTTVQKYVLAVLSLTLPQMLNGLVKSIALDLDVKSVANTARASKDSKIAEVGADIELLTR